MCIDFMLFIELLVLILQFSIHISVTSEEDHMIGKQDTGTIDFRSVG